VNASSAVRVLAIALLAVAGGLGLLYAYRSQTPAIPTMSQTEVVQLVQAGTVRDVVIEDGHATVTLVPGSRVRTVIGSGPDTPLVAAVNAYNRDRQTNAITLRYEPSEAGAWPILIGLLPILVIAALVVLAARALARTRDGDRYVQLARIADLRDRHALTEEEFAAEKRKIMG